MKNNLNPQSRFDPKPEIWTTLLPGTQIRIRVQCNKRGDVRVTVPDFHRLSASDRRLVRTMLPRLPRAKGS